MKRKSLILGLSIILILVIGGWVVPKAVCPMLWGKPVKELPCPPPPGNGANICCFRNNSLEVCTQETLRCGERVHVAVRINNLEAPYYICWNMSKLGLPWACSKKSYSKSFIFVEENLTIPHTEGNISLARIYYFHTNQNYTSASELLNNLNKSKEILVIYGEVKC